MQFFLVEKFGFFDLFSLIPFFHVRTTPDFPPSTHISFSLLVWRFSISPRNERKKGKGKDTRGELIFFFAWKGKKSFASRLFSQHWRPLVFPRIFFIKSGLPPNSLKLAGTHTKRQSPQIKLSVWTNFWPLTRHLRKIRGGRGQLMLPSSSSFT